MRRLVPIVVLLLALFWVAPGAKAQDTSPKGFVENLLESMLAAEGRSLSVENVSISVTGDVTVGHVEVSDDQGPWLVLDDLSVAWQPLSLFADQLEVDDISVGHVHMLRMSQSPEGSVSAPQEMQDLSAARIDRLAIGKLTLDEPVLGQAVEMKLDGSGEITAAPVRIRADLTASRLDGKKGDLNLKVDLDPRTRQFVADVTLAEEADGVVANLLSLGNEATVALDLKAAGDFAKWSGDFVLAINGERTIEGRAAAAPGDLGQTVTVDGTGRMARLLPQSLAQVFDGVSTLSASAFLPREGGAAEIDHVTLDSAEVAFKLSGIADWSGTRSNLVAELAAKSPDAAIALPQSGLLGTARVAGLKAGFQVRGALSAPDWQVTLGWGSLDADRLTLDDVSASLSGHGFAPGAQPVTFKGNLTGKLANGRTGELPPALLGALSGDIAGEWRDGDVIEIARADLSAGAVTLNATGQAKPQTGTFDVSLSARTDSPRTGNDVVDALLNGPVTAEGRVRGGGDSGLALEGVTFTSAALKAEASGQVAADRADLSLDASLADLHVLHPDMTGSLTVRASASGRWSDLQAQLDARGEDVTLLGKAFTQPVLTAGLTLKDTTMSGNVSFGGDLSGKAVRLSAALNRDESGALMLKDVSATAGSAQASGELQWPSGGLPVGRFRFDVPDLADVGPLLLTDVGGTVSGDIEMRGAGATHETVATFKARDLAASSFAAARAEGSFTVLSLFDQPRPSGSLAMASVRVGGQSFDIVDVEAKAVSADSFSVVTSLKGRDLSADATAQIAFTTEGATYRLSSLSGRMRGVAFKAAAPFEVRQRGDAVSVSDAAIAIGEGRVTLDGQITPRLDAKVVVASVPLSAFETAAGIGGLRGTLSGRASIAGDLSAPQGSYDLQLSGFSLAMLQDQGLGSFDAVAKGTIKGTVISATVNASSGKALTISGSGTADLSPNGRIDMAIKGAAGSRLFGDRLADSGLRVEGDVGFDLRLAGATARPEVSGVIDISKGVIGDAAGQFTVRNVKGRLSLANDELQIVSLTGQTGRKGSASASGRITFRDGVALDLKAKVSNGNYTDGSLVTARYDADLAITGGTASGVVVSGDITLSDTKITLSELPQRAVSPVDVKHTNAPADVKRQAAQLGRFTSKGGSDVLLDIRLVARDTVSVSGRGLNVVLNGGLRLRGPTGNLSAQGSFELFRGRLTLPARSLDFERGTLTFDRGFDPLINFVAISRRSDATITLTVSGRASEPEISVTSVPELPPEEAMARLIFDNSMLELSPLQVAQIASYVATLTGGGGSGLLSGLQSALGVDYLTVRETENGDTEVGAAKRINDRLSIGVEQTVKSNTTRVIIDLSATKNIKLRGSVDTDQSSRIGVYFEKDY